MTFIASVVAKNGCAVIADSLVTTYGSVMEWRDFTTYLESAKKNPSDGSFNLSLQDLVGLFKSKPSHTKNFEEKLFIYDNYSIITTAGSAEITGKKIEDLMEEIISKNELDSKYASLTLEEKVLSFCNFFSEKISASVNAGHTFQGTSFIYTNYNKENHKTSIYKIKFNPGSKEKINNQDFSMFEYTLQPEQFKVVCDGQNRISERILFGDPEIHALIPKVISQVVKDHSIQVENPKDYEQNVLKTLRDSGAFNTLNDDMKMFQISSLSLQQSVDLACLLMRLEMDIQQYTKNIPTVGGLIKLATISKDGVKLITGDAILKPEFIR